MASTESKESKGYSIYTRRGFRWGALVGAILLVGITVVVVYTGMEHGFSGESLVLWGYLAFTLSFPTTFWIILLFGFVLGFLPVGFVVVVGSVLLNWALIGAAIGAVVGKVSGFRRGRGLGEEGQGG